jgi:anti-sigma factor RsiW
MEKMMTINDKLKIQAYVDGELDKAEAKKVEALIATDAEARNVYEELKTTATLLKENEPEVKLSVPRELYWQQIYSKIQQAESKPVSVFEYISCIIQLAFSRKYLVPVTAAIAIFAGVLTVKEIVKPTEDYLVVIENVADDIGSYSFRASSEKMFVVWIYNKETESPKPVNNEPDDLTFEGGVSYQ